MRKTCISTLLAAITCLGTTANAQKLLLMNHLPEQYNNYQVDQWLDYEGKALFDYINGGAELYLSYGLKGMTGAKYEGKDLPQITVEVYEMTEAKNAFGVFTQTRDRDEYAFGQHSQSFDDFIMFWKDKYFVIVRADRANTESTNTIRHLAVVVEQAITQRGSIPAIVRELPPLGLVPGGYLYFHHYIWLNAYLFIADYNLFNIDDSTDALLAKYGGPDERAYLLLVTYPDEAAAAAAARQLNERYAPEWTPEQPIIQLEDHSWFAFRIQENKVAAIFDGKSREQVEQLFQSIK